MQVSSFRGKNEGLQETPRAIGTRARNEQTIPTGKPDRPASSLLCRVAWHELAAWPIGRAVAEAHHPQRIISVLVATRGTTIMHIAFANPRMLFLAGIAALLLSGCNNGAPAVSPTDAVAAPAPSQEAASEADTTRSASLAGAARWADPGPADLADGETYTLPGLIRAELNFVNLQQAFGTDNVQLIDIEGAEGESVQGAVLFPDDPARRAEVFFRNPEQHSGIDTVRVRGESSRWHFTSGVQPGMSLDELVQANGAPVSFFGLDWDYGGAVTDWHDGAAVPAGGLVRLAPSGQQVGPYPVGEDTYRSDDPHYPQQGELLRVSEIGMGFGD